MEEFNDGTQALPAGDKVEAAKSDTKVAPGATSAVKASIVASKEARPVKDSNSAGVSMKDKVKQVFTKS